MDFSSAAAIVKRANSIKTNETQNVQVVVRCRPLFGKEIAENRKSIISMDNDASVVSIQNPNGDNQMKSFTFDYVYDENSNQQSIYEETAYPLIESIFEGYNGTIFAYGQTGAGKTHSMQGSVKEPGIIPQCFDHIYEFIEAEKHNREFLVRVSYLEIYNEEIRDLLGENVKQFLPLKQSGDSGVFVKDLTEIVVATPKEMLKVMNKGFKNRSVGSTQMNAGSSRSHSIFTIMVEMSETKDGEERLVCGKLNLVDLAGSERQSKTQAKGTRLKEGCKINLSLSALGNVISALVDGKGKHIPYRDSKLTRLLKDSLGGNTKTIMIAAISPADYNYDETMSTLRYANRAKNIKNKPIVNNDPKDAKLQEYRDEIERLRQQLLTSQSKQVSSLHADPSSSSEKTFETVKEDQENVALKEINAQILNEKNQMGERLENTEKEIESHKREKEELIFKLKQFQSQLLGRRSNNQSNDGNLANDDSEAILDSHQKLAKEKAEYRRAQIKLRAKRKKEVQLKRAKEALLIEKQMIEEELKTAQEAAEANIKVHRKKNSKYKAKLESARQEISDLMHEFQSEREQLIDTVREQSQEIRLLEQIVNNFLPLEEIAKVWEKSQWVEDDKYWILPQFQPRRGCTKIVLPNLPRNGVSINENISGGMEIKDDSCTKYSKTQQSKSDEKNRSKLACNTSMDSNRSSSPVSAVSTSFVQLGGDNLSALPSVKSIKDKDYNFENISENKRNKKDQDKKSKNSSKNQQSSTESHKIDSKYPIVGSWDKKNTFSVQHNADFELEQNRNKRNKRKKKKEKLYKLQPNDEKMPALVLPSVNPSTN